MAPRYWVGGTASWDATAGTKWATTSGGGGGSAVPTSSDDVYFDGASGAVTVTIGATANCANLDCTGFTGTLAGSSALNVAGTSLFKLASGMTFSYTGALTFTGTSGNCLITSAGKTMDCPVTFNGAGGSRTLQDTCTWGATRAMTLTTGTLDLNGQTASVGTFSSTGTGTRVFNFTGGTLNLTNASGTTTVWNTTDQTNMTTDGTGTVNLTGASSGARTVVHDSSPVKLWGNLTISAGSGTVARTNVNCNDFTCTSGYTGSLVNSTMSVRGNYTLHANNGTPTAGSNVTTFAATSGTKTIDGGGKTCDFPITFNGVGGSWQFAADWVGAASRILTLTNGAIDINGKTIAVDRISSTANNVRGFDSSVPGGVVSCLSASASAVGVFNFSTAGSGTNATISNPDNWIISIDGAGTGSRDIHCGGKALGAVRVTAGSGAVTFNSGGSVRGLTGTSGFTGACNNANWMILGPVQMHANNAPPTAGTTAWTLAATSGVNTLDTAGLLFDFPLTINAPGGTYELASGLTMGSTRTLTLTQGTLDLDGWDIVCSALSTSNSNTRELAFGAGTLELVGTGTVLNAATATGLTVTPGTGRILLSAATASARTISSDAAVTLPAVEVSAGSGDITLTNVNLDGYTQGSGYTGILQNTVAVTNRGGLSLHANNGTPASGGFRWTYTSTGAETIDTAGKVLAFPHRFDGVGGEWTLTNGLNAGSSTVSLYNGTVRAGAQAFVADSLNFFGIDTAREIDLGSGAHQLSGSIPINVSTPTNLTVTPGTSTIALTNGSPLILGGGKTWPAITCVSGADLTIGDSGNTFADLTLAGTGASLSFIDGATTTFEDWHVAGTLGDLVAVSSPTTPHTLVNASGAPIVGEYLTLTRSYGLGTGNADWTADATCVDGGGNAGWWESATAALTAEIAFVPSATAEVGRSAALTVAISFAPDGEGVVEPDEVPTDGWGVTALVQPWNATGTDSEWGCIALVQPWNATGRTP